MKLKIKRTYHIFGTNGKLFINNVFCCYTIELPWMDNIPNKSCIPSGKYVLEKRTTKKRGSHLLLKNVPDRSLILIHPANTAILELKGCIAPVNDLIGEGVGTESRKACELVYKQVFAALDKGEEVTLEIVNDEL